MKVGKVLLHQIEQELYEQQEKWGGHKHDKKHNVHDWHSFIIKHADKTVEPKNYGEYRKNMIRVVALGISAILTYEKTLISEYDGTVHDWKGGAR